MARREGKLHTSRNYPLSAFSEAEWDSEERRRYLEEYGRDVNPARAHLEHVRRSLGQQLRVVLQQVVRQRSRTATLSRAAAKKWRLVTATHWRAGATPLNVCHVTIFCRRTRLFGLEYSLRTGTKSGDGHSAVPSGLHARSAAR